MRQAARLAAAIDVLAAWADGQDQIDHVLASWGRSHRFAGAKDRAAIGDRVYLALRRRGEGAFLFDTDTPRAWVLGALALEDGLNAGDLDALLASAPHAPAPLSVEERKALARHGDTTDATALFASAPPWAKGNYPRWLHEELARSLGARLEDEMRAMALRAPLDVRVNRLKTTLDGAAAALVAEGVHAARVGVPGDALRLAPGVPVTRTRAYEQGWIEVQDAAAQIAAQLAVPPPGGLVVELAAGAGGKALAFAAAMGNRGRIVACDVDAARLARLGPRASRAGATCIETRVLAPALDVAADPALAPLEGQADLVVLDVPCSGSGTWRRHPDQKWRLTASELARLTAVQGRLLAAGARLVRPGGRLAYMTCSLLQVENDMAIAEFLARVPGFRVVPPDDALARAGLAAISCWRESSGVSLSPVTAGTDGFYVAVLDR